jgi:hypothetical protein
MILPWAAVIPPESAGGWVEEAPKDGEKYARKEGRRVPVYLKYIDGGYADPNQTEIIDWWGA